MTQYYTDKSREKDPHALPDLEVWEIRDTTPLGESQYVNEWGELSYLEPGWYWWSCFPGCLPDSEPMGPFASEEEALADAREGAEDFHEIVE